MKNKKLINVGVVGIAGKMGKAIANLVINDSMMALKAGSEHMSHKFFGKDLGLVLGRDPMNVLITDDMNNFFKDIDIVIEFGLEDATIKFLKEASKRRVAFLSGSTGLSVKTQKLMKKLSLNMPVLWSPNMSIGANLLKDTAKKIAFSLGRNFDIDITDIHHKNKRDVPSGTALSIKDEVQEVLKSQNIKKKINVSAIRAGDATGEHSVIFSGSGERITITHLSTSRIIFANGAVEIAKWLHVKKAGYYSMQDYLASKS
ncbi:MAG: 4-hydroxy-tetrahydrodipicolinate reductase [Pseudomonadota bacterium]|nr:4-hydroxy-tetrahydrodipicolinate reductase [Pseudomonadota bacterium]